MENRLDDLARTMAADEGLPRRKALGRMAAAMGGGFLAVFAGGRPAAAAPPVKCPPGFTNCQGLCRDVTTNPDHCGACGHSCAANQLCRGGICTQCTCVSGPTPCPPNLTNCGDGTCADLMNDPNNCGVCGKVCQSGVCSNGNCTTVCQPGSTHGTCTAGIGACERTGVLRCSESGEEILCDAVPGAPSVEVCNGIDDDCDGLVDEGNPGGGHPCLTAEGEAGTTFCVNGGIVCIGGAAP